jgi:hypothetical protein
MVHVLGFQALVEALHRQRARDTREEEEREREREREREEDGGTRRKGAQEEGETIKKRREVWWGKGNGDGAAG